jgi:hypothetical protein
MNEMAKSQRDWNERRIRSVDNAKLCMTENFGVMKTA